MGAASAAAAAVDLAAGRIVVRWQITDRSYRAASRLLGANDREKAGRAMQAMLGMSKIEIKGLQDAYEGRA